MPRDQKSTKNKKAQVNQHFSGLAEIYHEKNYGNPIDRGQYPDILIRHQRILEMVRTENGRMLDIGCGSGRLLYDLQNSGIQAFGVDYSALMVKNSRKLFRERQAPRIPGLVVGDTEWLGFKDKTFDLVVAAGVVEYLDSDEKALVEIRRILRPGGVAIISVLNKVNLSRPLILIRDALVCLPILGPLIESCYVSVKAIFFRKVPSSPMKHRWHVPWKLRRTFEEQGFKVDDAGFYHFAVCPPILKKLLPKLCVRIGMKLEGLSRSSLGYFATGYLIKVRLNAHKYYDN